MSVIAQPKYGYTKSFVFNNPAPVGLALGINAVQHWVTINDTLVKGFYLISVYVNMIVYDQDGAGNELVLNENLGWIESWCNFSNGLQPPFGDSANITTAPAGWGRDNLSFKANKQYYWYPGIYVAGNQTRLSIGVILDGGYVIQTAVNMELNYHFQLGFIRNPEGATDVILTEPLDPGSIPYGP